MRIQSYILLGYMVTYPTLVQLHTFTTRLASWGVLLPTCVAQSNLYIYARNQRRLLSASNSRPGTVGYRLPGWCRHGKREFA